MSPITETTGTVTKRGKRDLDRTSDGRFAPEEAGGHHTAGG